MCPCSVSSHTTTRLSKSALIQIPSQLTTLCWSALFTGEIFSFFHSYLITERKGGVWEDRVITRAKLFIKWVYIFSLLQIFAYSGWLLTETWAENPFLQIHCILVLDSGPALPYRIITQPRLPWWPQIDIVYNKSSELRSMFTDTLNKVTQGCISHTPLRMIQVSSWPYFFSFSLFLYVFIVYLNVKIFWDCD